MRRREDDGDEVVPELAGKPRPPIARRSGGCRTGNRCSRAVMLLLLCGQLFAAAAVAQEETQDPPAPAATEQEPPAQDPPVEAPSAGDSATTTPQPIPGADGIIYIPFQDLHQSFEKPDTEIVLPYAEYRRLLEAWRASQSDKVQPPAAVLTKADYSLVAEEHLARVTATLSINVLGPAWSQLPVDLGDAAVGGLTSDSDVLLRGVGDGKYLLLFPQTGEQTVTLEFTLRVKSSAEGRSAVLTIPTAAVATLDVTVPVAGQQIDLSPPAASLPVEETPAEQSRLKANLGAVNRVTVNWSPKSEEQPDRELFATVSNRTVVTVDEGLIHTDAWLTYEILRGTLPQARLVLPKSARILDLSADSTIGNWETKTEGDRQIVTVTLLKPAQKKVVIEVHTEQPLAGSEFSAIGIGADGTPHGVHALDVVRESGQVEIRHVPEISLTLLEQSGVVRIESQGVENRPSSSDAFSFRYYSPQVTLRLSAAPVTPRLLVEQSVDVLVKETEWTLLSRLQYRISRAGVFELRLRLPEALIIDDVRSAAMKEYRVDQETQNLVVTLSERTQEAVELVITARLPTPDSAATISLPLLEPIGVERETGTISVFSNPSVEVQTVADGLNGVQPLEITQARKIGEATLAAAWTLLRRPVEIPVRIVHKPTRLTAQVASTLTVQPQQTAVTSRIEFLVEHAGTDTFRIAVPAAFSEQVRIETVAGDAVSAPIKQKTAGEAEDGSVVWTVQTQRSVLGRQRFVVQFEIPHPDEIRSGSAFDPLSIVLPRPLGTDTTPLSSVQGEVELKKDRTLSITAAATGGDVEQVDPRELKTLSREGTIAFRYFRDEPVSLQVTAARYEIQEVVSTVVSRSLVEVVLGEDEAATYRCRYQLKSSERQRLLVYLPVNLELLGAFVNDREIRLEKAEESIPEDLAELQSPYWVNVSRPESSEEPFLLTLQFLWRVNPPLGESRFSRGQLGLPLPVIGAGGQRAAQETRVVIWVPREYALVGTPNQFELLTRRNSWSVLLGEKPRRDTGAMESWILHDRPAGESFAQLPTTGRHAFIYSHLGSASLIEVNWWSRWGMTALFSLTVALIGWVLMRTSCENKLGILLLAALGAALYGLKNPQGLSQVLHAATPGLLVLLGLWLLHGIAGCLHSKREPQPVARWNPQEIPYAVIPPPGVFDHLHPTSPEQNSP